MEIVVAPPPLSVYKVCFISCINQSAKYTKIVSEYVPVWGLRFDIHNMVRVESIRWAV